MLSDNLQVTLGFGNQACVHGQYLMLEPCDVFLWKQNVVTNVWAVDAPRQAKMNVCGVLQSDGFVQMCGKIKII